jgi:uncharacterized protein
VRLKGVLWKEQFVDKIESKHQISTEEVEQVLFTKPHICRLKRGLVKGEDLYSAYGQTEAGRYVIVFFIHKQSATALPISARDMDEGERKYYEKQKEKSR